ncbi:MAG: hypothetical protein R3F59_31240 [Myxococcota bacterium]
MTSLLAASAPLQVAAAVGTAGRFARDPDVARRWAEGLSEADRRRVEEDALREVGTAWDRLERVSDHAVLAEDGTHALASLVDLRDLLASAAWVLRSRALAEELDALDRAAVQRWSELPELADELGELCGEVAWREPWSWWGQLG